MGNLSAERKKAIQELIQGRDLANQLRIVLGNPSVGTDHDGGSVEAAGDLVAKILGSFTETISILNNRSRRPSDEHELPADTRVSSPCWDGPKSEDSEESSKTSALKDRRGCYKRRKTSQTSTRTTPNLIDDGHAWRKYGQKVILNAKHPRNYFRCTHKFDQGCHATKQVQRTEDDPPMYRITYHGNHTCKNLLKTPQIILDSTPTGDQYPHHHDDSSVLLSFAFGSTPNPNPNNNIVMIKQQQEPFFPTPAAPLIKQEHSNYKAEQQQQQPSCLEHNNNSQSSSSDHYLLSPDMTMTTFDSPDHGDRMSTGMYSSCTASPHGRHSLDMDLMLGLGSVDFDDVFSFEF